MTIWLGFLHLFHSSQEDTVLCLGIATRELVQLSQLCYVQSLQPGTFLLQQGLSVHDTKPTH